MKKLELAWGILFLSLWIVFSASAVSPIPMLQVTGVLVGIDEKAEPPIIELIVNEKQASGPLDKQCAFSTDTGEIIGRDEFVKRYKNRVITLELAEDTGIVYTCRFGE